MEGKKDQRQGNMEPARVAQITRRNGKIENTRKLKVQTRRGQRNTKKRSRTQSNQTTLPVCRLPRKSADEKGDEPKLHREVERKKKKTFAGLPLTRAAGKELVCEARSKMDEKTVKHPVLQFKTVWAFSAPSPIGKTCQRGSRGRKRKDPKVQPESWKPQWKKITSRAPNRDFLLKRGSRRKSSPRQRIEKKRWPRLKKKRSRPEEGDAEFRGNFRRPRAKKNEGRPAI